MLRIGIIGVGHLGKIHLKLIKELPAFELVGFYDHDDENSEFAVRELGVKRFSSFQELADQVDAIDIVTPALSHFEYASKSLRMSKHVFIEKPITYSTKEAKTLVSLAEEANVKVQIGHVERFNPAFIAALPFISHPMFIETKRLANYNPRGMDVSVAVDVMIHDIDIILSLIKSPIKRVSSVGAAVIGKTADMINARLEFANGAVANLSASRIAMKNVRETVIFQNDSYINIDFLNKTTQIIRHKAAGSPMEGKDFAMELASGQDGNILQFITPPIISSNAIKSELEQFASAIENDTPTPVTIEAGYEALNIANKINEILRLRS
ncbi:MAG: Gfo/Idh/MocA family oxidoreductase [Bacteroidota bacterium]